MYFEKLASAIQNDVLSGLRGYHHNLSMSMEQLEDDIVDERLAIIKEYKQKGILSLKELALSINCINVNCEDIAKCSKCSQFVCSTPASHFEIPQVIELLYVGSIDKQTPFIVYDSITAAKNHKYRKRGVDKPYVWVDTTPNENGMNDCFIFNAPLIKSVSVVGVFKDPRQLCNYDCNLGDIDDNLNSINSEIKKRLTEKKLRYYRQFAKPLKPNDQTYSEG